MLCCGRKKGRGTTTDIAASPRRQPPNASSNNQSLKPPPMVVQGDFRKVSGISTEIFRQIETIENEYDASTAAALDAVERRGEMIVRLIDTKNLGKAASDAAKKFLNLQDSRYSVLLVEIIKRPGQTLGLYIREGNALDRNDGVFISRIALESAVYNSGCIQVGDEILAVNLVDVTSMSIDDVVIIMSIPRRLVLATRQSKARSNSAIHDANLGTGLNYGLHYGLHHNQNNEPKPPPVVVIKKDLSKEEEIDDDDDERCLLPSSMRRDIRQPQYESRENYQSQLALDSNNPNSMELYYNSRPNPRKHQSSTLDRRLGYSYLQSSQENPSANTAHTSNTNNIYERTYPKTLESLAEKVHPFCPGGSTLGRRTSEISLGHYGNRKTGIRRSGSDQHLARTEYDDFRRTLPARQSHTLQRPSYKQYGSGSYARQYSTGLTPHSYYTSSLTKKRTVDYASDTEAAYSTNTRSSYYYCKPSTSVPQRAQGMASSTLSRLGNDRSLARSSSLRSNSLPRDIRPARDRLQMSSQGTNILDRYGGGKSGISRNILDSTEDRSMAFTRSILDSNEINRIINESQLLPSNRRPGTYGTSVFTADEYRAWLSKTPSTSAIYERLKAGRDSNLHHPKGRFTFSAENLSERTKELDLSDYSSNRSGVLGSLGLFGITPLPSATISTLDRHTRTASLRRLKHLQELEAKHLGSRTIFADVQIDKSRVLDINPNEFIKYKLERTSTNDDSPGVSGILWLHLLAGRGLRVYSTSNTTSEYGMSNPTRDLYCVLECDKVHKARTVVRNGDLVFDWDETFELDLISNKELDFLVYSWDPQYRHKLCYKATVNISSLMQQSMAHHIAVKMEPRGTLYLKLRLMTPYYAYLRKPAKPILQSRGVLSTGNLFGVDLETVVQRETGALYASVSSNTQPSLETCVPVVVQRCIKEVERRGLEITGLYRLCGSATKKRILRDSFERNSRTVDLSPDNVPDINVITGVFKDYLRELPEPLFTKYLYQMIVDALSVCLSEDTQGNAKLMISLLDCLPRIPRATLVCVIDHLALVTSHSPVNKMNAHNLASCFAPLLMIKSDAAVKDIEFSQPINILRYLLEIWPSKSVREVITGPEKSSVAHMAQPHPLLKKPNDVLDHDGTPLPIPLKGIRRTPPAVPARSIPVVGVSQVTEFLSDENEQNLRMQPNVAAGNSYGRQAWPRQNNEPPEIPARTKICHIPLPSSSNELISPGIKSGSSSSPRSDSSRRDDTEESSLPGTPSSSTCTEESSCFETVIRAGSDISEYSERSSINTISGGYRTPSRAGSSGSDGKPAYTSSCESVPGWASTQPNNGNSCTWIPVRNNVWGPNTLGNGNSSSGRQSSRPRHTNDSNGDLKEDINEENEEDDVNGHYGNSSMFKTQPEN